MGAFTEDQIDKAIELYLAGAKVVAIEEETGVHRAGLYYHMKQRGLTPRRQPSAKRGPKASPQGDGQAFTWAMERVEQLAAENARLRALLEESGIPVPE